MQLNVGKHCHHEGCQQLDFLPFTCDQCKNVYCLDHRMYDAHHCGVHQHRGVVPQCPLCNAIVSVRDGEDINRVMEQHIVDGCKGDRKLYKDSPKCSHIGCTTKVNYTPINCQRCKKVYCVHHHLPEEHRCPHPTATALPNVPSLMRTGYTAVSRVLGRSPQSNQSVGPTTSLDDRFNMQVYTAPTVKLSGNQTSPLAVHFNKRWSVGKCMDWLVEYLKLNPSERYRFVTIQSLQVVSNSLVLHDSGRNYTRTPHPNLSEGVVFISEKDLNAMNTAASANAAATHANVPDMGCSSQHQLASLVRASQQQARVR